MSVSIQQRVLLGVSRLSGGRAATAFLLALALTCVPSTAVAQRATAVRFERLAQEHGLSNGTVTALVQGRSGFLWMGTEDGLNRYDGSGFVTYRSVPGDSTSLGHSWVTSLLVARNGSLWIGTLNGGLSRLIPQRNSFQRYRHAPDDSLSLSSNRVSAIHETADGFLWVGSAAGLDRLDPATGLVERYTSAAGLSTEVATAILALAEDESGVIWVGTRTGALLFDRAAARFRTVELGMRESTVRALARGRDGTIWVGTEHELTAVDPVRLEVRQRYRSSTARVPSPFGGRVMTLFPGPDGALWIGSDDGLTRLDPSTGRYERHRQIRGDPLSLGGTIVRSILEDRGGVLWVGLESYGLGKHAPSAIHFETIRDDPSSPVSISNGYVRGISEDRAGNIWIATQFGGLNRYDRSQRRVTTYRHSASDPASLPGNNVWASLEDHKGQLWVGLHQRGVGTLDPRTGSFTRSPVVDTGTSVNVLYEDRSGNLLIGTEGKGMIELSRDRKHVYRYSSSAADWRRLESDDIQTILEDSEGMLWAGGTDGLTRVDRRGSRVTHFRAGAGEPGQLPNPFITSIAEDRFGRLWFASKGGGLSSLDRDSDRFTTIGTSQGLPHSFIYGILEDANGNLWISSDDGIARRDSRTGQFTRYGLEDGLQAREFNRRAYHRSADGTMFLGGINGLTIFHPDAASSPSPTQPVSFLGLQPANGSRLRLMLGFTEDSVMKLRHDENAFSIIFRSMDYSEPQRIVYSYRLDGVDRNWVNGGNRGAATYSSVPPGRYVFRVTAARRDRTLGERTAAVTIVVLPPWWGTWWARSLGVLVAAALVAGLIRLRLAAARRRSAWLERRVEAQTRQLTASQARLHAALEGERAAARELSEMTAAVPGAVFQMRETADGRREFPFVSEGVRRLWLDRFPDHPQLAADDGDRGLIAERLMALAHPQDVPELERSLSHSRATLQPWQAEWRLIDDDITSCWLSVQARVVSEAGGSMVWTGVITDVTAAREAESARATLEAKVLQAQQAESLGVLAGGIAHDFNNLLVGVLGNAELLEDELPPGSDGLQTVGHIRQAAMRASDLTRQLLAYAGKGCFVVEPLDLVELVGGMLALVRSAVPRTIAFEFRGTDGPAPIVEADATQLRQVVMNLVTNASEAIGARPGQVTVRVAFESRPRRALSLLHVAPEMPASGPYALIEVTDDGVGLDPLALSRIFDPFYSTKFTGRGLGLAALLGIVRAHRGALSVITAPGNGSCFRIYLPLANVAVARAHEAGHAGSESLRHGDGQRILVVDDEADVRHLTQRMLRKLGYDVLGAANGVGAVAAVDSGEVVSLVLMDVTMPAMDGPATARALRERGVDVPIVLMSGYAEAELAARGALSDSAGFLQKPFSERELALVMENAAGEPLPVEAVEPPHVPPASLSRHHRHGWTPD